MQIISACVYEKSSPTHIYSELFYDFKTAEPDPNIICVFKECAWPAAFGVTVSLLCVPRFSK